MELTKKTTILFTPDLYLKLEKIAREQGTSVGNLVRQACERQHKLHTTADRLKAVNDLAELRLPVGSPEDMEVESAPRPATE